MLIDIQNFSICYACIRCWIDDKNVYITSLLNLKLWNSQIIKIIRLYTLPQGDEK